MGFFVKISKLLSYFSIFFIITLSYNAHAKICWKNSYGRGVGTIPSSCAQGQVKSGLLCYNQCQDGYENIAGVCWQKCPAGFKDTGLDCLKPSSYGRGDGYWIWHKSKCQEQNPQGCEKWGAMWYPKCASGFHNVDCCVCSPDCPAGMKDIGVSCQKNTYVEAPIDADCGSKQYDDGLCYDYCKADYSGVGPVCWGQCPEGYENCGLMCISQGSCAGTIFGQIDSIGEMVLKIGSLISTFGASAAETEGEEAAESAAVAGLKAVGEKLAKEIEHKIGKLDEKLLIGIVYSRLKASGVPSFIANIVAKYAVDPSKVDPMTIIKGLDPTGIADVVAEFEHSTCSVEEVANTESRSTINDDETGKLAASSSSQNTVNLFARSYDLSLIYKSFNNTWSNWQSLGGILSSAPAATSSANGKLNVFVRGSDNALWYKTSTNGVWSDWQSLGGALSSAPAVASWGGDRLDVFVRGTDNALWHLYFDGSWSAWESLGGVLSSSPSVASWGNGRLDVFARATDNALWHLYFDGSWSAWESLGGVLSSSPSVASWGNGRLDVFARGTDNALWHLYFDGSWSAWESLGGILTSAPAAISPAGEGSIDIFVRGEDNTIYLKSFRNAWSDWQSLGG
jgi:hypothetical protein